MRGESHSSYAGQTVPSTSMRHLTPSEEMTFCVSEAIYKPEIPIIPGIANKTCDMLSRYLGGPHIVFEDLLSSLGN